MNGLWTCGAAPASLWATHGRQTAAVHGLPTGSQAGRGPTGSTAPTAASEIRMEQKQRATGRSAETWPGARGEWAGAA